MMVKWCGTCAHKGACDNARYMECTSAPFKLWKPIIATCETCAMRSTSKCSDCVYIITHPGDMPSEWRPIPPAEAECRAMMQRVRERIERAKEKPIQANEAKADAGKPKDGMSSAEFERLMEEQIERSRNVLCNKAKEYATQDRLHNFRVAAGLQGCTPIQALSGMMAKHTVSVYDMCESGKAYPIDLWQEKITDSINYLLILNAMVREGS